MGRPKTRDTQSITIRMDSTLFDRLSDYCERSGQTKTVAVERALSMFIDDYDKKMEMLASIEADKAK